LPASRFIAAMRLSFLGKSVPLAAAPTAPLLRGHVEAAPYALGHGATLGFPLLIP
jgi:hypothetical protein